MSDSEKVVPLHPDPLAATAARLQRILRTHRARVTEELEARLDQFLEIDPSNAKSVNLVGLPMPIETALALVAAQLDELEVYLSTPRGKKPGRKKK